MRKYKITDDSGVDYGLLGEDREKRPWVGQVVRGSPNPSLYPDAITIEKPYGLTGTYTASASAFKDLTPRMFEFTGKIVLGFILNDRQHDILLDEGELELRDGTVYYYDKKGGAHKSITTPNIIDVSLEHGRIREITKGLPPSEGVVESPP